ncbi:hypothetical protein GUJ93_ZPchr0011g27632 [Zizania palustris]|uniref:Uncharacterized protein n=1 Tax=Zizania palustris TaxID=103762 RepID=A0A8J5WII9_ZIZPA|nr:hypothetical protein GUJ93_ZPchr0011g27632 [Zizania palustris]
MCLAWNLMEQSGSKKRIFLSDPEPSVPPKKKEPSGSFLPRPSPSAARMPPSRKNQVHSFFFLPPPYPLLSALSSQRRAPGGRALEAAAPRVLAAGVARLAAARWRPPRLVRWLPASCACLLEPVAAPDSCVEEIRKLCFQIWKILQYLLNKYLNIC